MMHDETSLATFSVATAVKPSPAEPAPVQPTIDPARPCPASAEARRGERRVNEEVFQVFHIRLADLPSHQEATSVLIRKMYGWRGYAVGDGKAPDDRITLLAECRGAVVGTMGLCLDGPAGLPADDHFREQLDGLRAQGRQLCEPSRLAIDAGMSKRVFASMIHVSYLFAHVIYGFTDYVIEVNPRHVAFYQRMLGFEQAGPARSCSRVGAPAVLMRLPLSHMGEQIAACGGRAGLHGDERSFYAFFFSQEEEANITARLRARCNEEYRHG